MPEAVSPITGSLTSAAWLGLAAKGRLSARARQALLRNRRTELGGRRLGAGAGAVGWFGSIFIKRCLIKANKTIKVAVLLSL